MLARQFARVLRTCRSVTKNGAGDSGQMISPGVPALLCRGTHTQRCQRVECLREVIERPRIGVENGNIRLHQGRAVAVGSAAGFIEFAGCRAIAAASEAVSKTLRRARGTRKAAATAVFTSAISKEMPYTPVTVAMRERGMLSICVVPSKSQGNPVI